MRIISGTFRGKRLATFAGKEIRPTSDRVREALFSMLTSRFGAFTGLKVLDLYCGTGALALEALSRGAGEALLIDARAESLALAKKNIITCHCDDRATLQQGEIPAFLNASPRPLGKFDLILLDPPYGKGLVELTLHAISRKELLSERGVVVVETGANEPLPEEGGDLTLSLRRRYGATAIALYERIDQPI